MSTAPLVEEAIVRLDAADRTLFEWRCTPADLAALAIGRLFIEGYLADAATAAQLDSTRTPTGDVALRLPALPAPSGRSPSPRTGMLPDVDMLVAVFRELFAGVDARHESGGMHAAALVRDGRIVRQAEDVGRHNTIDKVIGQAILAGDDPAGCGLLVTARVSGEIARKAAAAGVAWLASRSIPTTLAVSVAAAAGMPIIGRAASRHASVYP